MFRPFKRLLAFASLSLLLCACSGHDELSELKSNFENPPESARPGVYWYFMDGNISKERITTDLEAMKDAGIGYVTFLEVNVGVPRGKVDFFSDEWKECFVHAVRECERLGIAMTLGIGPGWTGSGGPWVEGAQSMQHMVASATDIVGGGFRKIKLDKATPMTPFFGEGSLTPELKQRSDDFYEDISVIAFPKTAGKSFIDDKDNKAIFYRAPYSSQPGVKQYYTRDLSPVDQADIVFPDNIIDLTAMLSGDTLTWDVPEGEWTVLRLGARNNGAVTRPAPMPGIGFECNKADTTALKVHFDVFVNDLITRLGDLNTDKQGGLKYLHIDSWEVGAQNWTPGFREEFTRRRGYDPMPFYPVYAGYIVGSKDMSERFMWDLRQTMQELMLENHAAWVRRYAADHGLQLSIEPYDMNPMQDLELGAKADVPMAEFWSPGGFNTTFSAVEASSLANIKGQRVLPAESFTANGDGWRQHPASMKNQTDWAFAAGVNRIVFHTYQHQALNDTLRPGMTMGPFGVHWDRNQTWWPYVGAYHKYIARCQYLLQQTATVADILYVTPEEAPYVFRAPKSALVGDTLIDKRGYNFDACPLSLLKTASVKDGRIVFPSGASYRIMVLPNYKTMTPAMLAKIEELVDAGAVLVGMPPEHTPGLEGYPEAETELLDKAAKIWGDAANASGLVSRKFGKGTIFTGKELLDKEDNLYPSYDLTEAILGDSLGICPDFSAEPADIRYIHKTKGDIDLFFVSNRTVKTVDALCTFRTSGRQPQLWNPVDGSTRDLTSFTDNGTCTTIDLRFEPEQSFFIVFAGKPRNNSGKPNFPEEHQIAALDGPWTVNFDPKWGGSAETTFPELSDWSTSEDSCIRYYSGTAVYNNKFKLEKPESGRLVLSLGDVKNIARVKLNGKDLGVLWSRPWKVDITDAAVDGDNELEIEITNLWINRLIGDEHLPDDGIVGGQWPEWFLKGEPRPSKRYTFATWRHYSADSPLQPSGLLGPVTVSIAE